MSDSAFFKVKSSKRSNPEARTTLDAIHNQKVQTMLEEKDNIAKSYSCKAAIKAGDKLSEKEMLAAEKEIDQLIKSVNKLQLKYKNLFYLIENDPELKKYVEAKMNKAGNN
jgi:DNA mismatch repair ATPase MutL